MSSRKIYKRTPKRNRESNMKIEKISITYKCDGCFKEKHIGHYAISLDTDNLEKIMAPRSCSSCHGTVHVKNAFCRIAPEDLPDCLKENKEKAESNLLDMASSLGDNLHIRKYSIMFKCVKCNYTWVTPMFLNPIDAATYYEPYQERFAPCGRKNCHCKRAKIIAVEPEYDHYSHLWL